MMSFRETFYGRLTNARIILTTITDYDSCNLIEFMRQCTYLENVITDYSHTHTHTEHIIHPNLLF